MVRAPESPQPLPPAVRSYLDELVRRSRAVCGPGLRSVLAVGSIALGDYRHGRSDIDVLVVVGPSVTGAALRELAAVLSHARLPCPAPGLELVVHGEDPAGRPSGGAGYLMNLNTGPLLPERVSFDPAESPSFWYVIDRAVARQAGRTLFGAPAEEVIAPPAPSGLLAAVRASVREHGEGEGHLADNRVLNGCRAVVFCRTGRWAAKRAAAHGIAAAEPRFGALVEAAVASFERPRAAAAPLPEAEVRAFLAWVREGVDEAAAGRTVRGRSVPGPG